MKRLATFVLLLTLLPLSFAKDKKDTDKKTESQDPIAWGILSRNSGCVIFEESRQRDTAFYGIALKTKTYWILKVIETQDYTLEKKTWQRSQEDMDALQRLAVKDKIKLVKIPEKYSSEQLEKARVLCKQAL